MEEYKPTEPKPESTISPIMKKIGKALLIPSILYLAAFGCYKLKFDESKVIHEDNVVVKRLVLPFDKVTYQKSKTYEGTLEQMTVQLPLRKPSLVRMIDIDHDNKVDIAYAESDDKLEKEKLNTMWAYYKDKADINLTVDKLQKEERERYKKYQEESKTYKPNEPKTSPDNTPSFQWWWHLL